MNKNILVTGGSGFIGTNVVDFFIKKGYNIKNVDCETPINNNHLLYWENINILDFNLLRNCIIEYNPRYIIHLAARTDLGGKFLDDYSTNTLGVENLLKITNELKELKKIIITSSMLVCRVGYNPKDQFDYNPTTVYGESKVKTEEMVWKNKPFCDWAIIRPTSIWGPGFKAPYKNFFDMVIAKRYFHIKNNKITKTYGYVGNFIFQMERILFVETKDELNKVFYIGDYIRMNIEEWGNEIASELGYRIRKLPYFIIKMLSFLGDVLKLFGVYFPMNSFRLKNMTTNNIIDLENTQKIAPILPYSRIEGVKLTLKWMLDKTNQN